MMRMECHTGCITTERPAELLATLYEDGRLEGTSPVIKDIQKIVDYGLHENLFDYKNPYADGPTLRTTKVGDPFFLYRVANYFARQSGGWTQWLVYG